MDGRVPQNVQNHSINTTRCPETFLFIFVAQRGIDTLPSPPFSTPTILSPYHSRHPFLVTGGVSHMKGEVL